MKRLIAISLIVGVLFQSMNKLVVIANYEIHKDYIAKNLCENRGKPKMKCCGKCYLKKQLSKTEDNNSKPAPSRNDKNNDVVALIKQKITMPEQLYLTIKSFNFSKENLYTFDFLSAQFHPPSIAA